MEQSNRESRTQMENRLEKFETDLKVHLNMALSSLRTDMSVEFERVDDQIKTIHEKMASMEVNQSPHAPAPDPNVIHGPPTSDLDTERNICIKLVPEEDEADSVEKLLQFTNGMLNALNVEVKVVCAKRVGERASVNNAQSRRARPAIITFETVSEKTSVLKAKRNLRDIDQYRNVYVEPDKTRHQRILESNTRAIVNKVAGLKMRGGRVIYESFHNSQSRRLSDISLANWNVNGFYIKQANKSSYELRETIIDFLNVDIVSLCETHLKHDEQLTVPGYKWIGHNRQNLSPNAVRGSGGVGFLIKLNILETFEVSILDTSYEDIMWIKLTDKLDSDFGVYLCSCYLPPSGSSRGDTSQQFFDKLTSDIYQYQGDLPLFVMGDVNGRIGETQDYNETLEKIPQRTPIDKTRNQQGDTFIEFLKDTRMCVVNGRGNRNMDNFTSVSPKGLAVVDYVCTPYECLHRVMDFRVLLVSDCLHTYNITPGTAKLPDHSVLLWKVNLSDYECIQYQRRTATSDSSNTNYTSRNDGQPSDIPIEPQPHRKYNVTDIPTDMFHSDTCIEQINSVIQKLETSENITSEIDDIYTELLNVLHTEMDRSLQYKDVFPNAKKRRRHIQKPWWCDEIKLLWDKTRTSESAFLKYTGTQRVKSALRREYLTARRNFDKTLRRHERQYYAAQRQRITELRTQNPKDFWAEINKLGPRRNQRSVDAVLCDDGNVSNDPKVILNKWKSDFGRLFSIHSGDFNERFLHDIQQLTSEWESDYTKLEEYLEVSGTTPSIPSKTELNSPITYAEVLKSIMAAKSGKAVGIENIPNEILKLNNLTPILHRLFTTCFENNVVPSMWYKTIIHPILKQGKDYRDPMSYRAVSLMSTITKLFSSILNERIVTFMNKNNVLCDEQNGFRKLRSCLDHIYTLTTIIRNRKLQNKQTFIGFIDFSKAFDSVNRDCLWYKLLGIGIDGKVYNIIKSLYANVEACVRVNGQLSDWFSVDSGVRQGDNLAPTLFALFINDIARHVNELGLGVPLCDGDRVSILKYADDIVLIAESPEDLQAMLNTLSSWSTRWRLNVNIDKTKVMHCRKQSTPITDYVFTFNQTVVQKTSSYKYLGFEMNETLNYTDSVRALHDAGSRSLGALTAKYYSNKGLDFKTFEKLYYSTVVPITDYAAGVWGYKAYDKFDKLQYKALRTFLGVGKSTCLLAIEGDTGWLPPKSRRICDIIRLWHRLAIMDERRLTHRVFLWDLHITQRYRNTWCGDVKHVLQQCGLLNFFDVDLTQSISSRNLVEMVRMKLSTIRRNQWRDDILASPKLRTYITHKTELGAENYLDRFMTLRQRSALARFRCGSFPLAIELGRYRRPVTPVENRLCRVCDARLVEDEKHFLVQCGAYSEVRRRHLGTVDNSVDSKEQYCKVMLDIDPRKIAKYIIDAYELRNIRLADTR
ncbi:MAG: reverse transcriptase family protein [Sedimenticola sp.]